MHVEDIQALCKELPLVKEDIKWGNDLVFSIGGKMFCVVGIDQLPVSASFKVSEEEFEEVSSKEGFKPAPYVARYKWIWVDDISRLSKSDWKKYIVQAYELVKQKLPKKIRKELGL